MAISLTMIGQRMPQDQNGGKNAIGYGALGNSNSRLSNAFGWYALFGNKGYSDIAIGDSAGYGCNDSYRLFIGQGAKDSSTSLIWANMVLKYVVINNYLGIGKYPTTRLDIKGTAKADTFKGYFLGSSIGDTTSLSNRINKKVNITDTINRKKIATRKMTDSLYLGKTSTATNSSKFLNKDTSTSGIETQTMAKTILKQFASDTTVTAIVGFILYKTSDSSVYICRHTGTGKKWFKITTQ